jgi:glycine cleavage system H protein
VSAPEDALRYSPLHTWARVDDDGMLTVGITAHAQYELGELQYIGLPRVGAALVRDAAFGEVESTKTASDLYAPCSGTVHSVNASVARDPAIVNRDPYGAGWMLRIEPAHREELAALLDRAAYDALNESPGAPRPDR